MTNPELLPITIHELYEKKNNQWVLSARFCNMHQDSFITNIIHSHLYEYFANLYYQKDNIPDDSAYIMGSNPDHYQLIQLNTQGLLDAARNRQLPNLWLKTIPIAKNGQPY